jgi:hypothetical protein
LHKGVLYGGTPVIAVDQEGALTEQGFEIEVVTV